jgi:hypothetical protein
MAQLQAIIARQQDEIRAHRQALGLGEYTALKGTEVLYDRTVTYRNDQGEKTTAESVTLHIGERMAVLWLQNWPNPKSICRRLGTFEVHP